jgi:DNA-binding transcriptional regulator YiaG
MRLPDGRTLYVEVPGRWVTEDRDGSPALLPDAVRFLDRIQALAQRLDRPPSPGFVTSLREALGMTQAEFGEQLGVDKMTVSRWERGALRPSDESIKAIEQLRRKTVQRGVTIPS